MKGHITVSDDFDQWTDDDEQMWFGNIGHHTTIG